MSLNLIQGFDYVEDDMNHLFDNTEKLVKFNRSLSQQFQIKHVLNPYTQSFIDPSLAHTLGILYNGYYRNRYGGLIPLHIAASKGFIEFTINTENDCEEMIIEYRSKESPLVANLYIRQVYDHFNQSMISYRQAMDKGYLDTEVFVYSCSNVSISIHEAFYRGWILGELRTNITEQKLPKSMMTMVKDNQQFEYDTLFSTLTNLVNSLSEFTHTIHVNDQYQLTTDGFIQEKKTGKKYILTQAMELGLVSFNDCASITQFESLENISTLVDEPESSAMDISQHDDEFTSEKTLFSDAIFLDLLKPIDEPRDDISKDNLHLTNIQQFLSVINTC